MENKSLKIIIIFICIACNNKKNINVRTINIGYKEKFVGFAKRIITIEDTLTFLESALNNGFELEPIRLSSKEKEIRIFYVAPFRQRFFRQQCDSGTIKSELYNCGIFERNDSFYIKIGASINSAKKYSKIQYPITNFLPDYKIYNPKIKGVLDAGSTFFVQIKDGENIIKKMIVENPCTKDSKKDAELENICIFLTALNKDNNFRFWDSWDSTIIHAFIE
jgi:hypothetical protein